MKHLQVKSALSYRLDTAAASLESLATEFNDVEFTRSCVALEDNSDGKSSSSLADKAKKIVAWFKELFGKIIERFKRFANYIREKIVPAFNRFKEKISEIKRKFDNMTTSSEQKEAAEFLSRVLDPMERAVFKMFCSGDISKYEKLVGAVKNNTTWIKLVEMAAKSIDKNSSFKDIQERVISIEDKYERLIDTGELVQEISELADADTPIDPRDVKNFKLGLFAKAIDNLKANYSRDTDTFCTTVEDYVVALAKSADSISSISEDDERYEPAKELLRAYDEMAAHISKKFAKTVLDSNVVVGALLSISSRMTSNAFMYID